MSDVNIERCWQCGAALNKTTGGNFCPLHGKVEPPLYLSVGDATAPKNSFYGPEPLHIQSIAERVCEVLAREVEETNYVDVAIGQLTFTPGLKDALHIITRPRDWAKELEEKK